MGLKIRDGNKYKYALYLRPQAAKLIESLKGDARSESSVVARLIAQYRLIQKQKPEVILQAKEHIEKHGIDFSSAKSVKKLQVYLDPKDCECLENFADSINSNISVAINRMLTEIMAIALINPAALNIRY